LAQSGHHELEELLRKQAGRVGYFGAVASISLNGPHYGVVRCQAIVCVQVLSNLVER